MIVGIDEVGRGCWAGPLAVGAVVLGGAKINGLTDSKKLTPRQRSVLAYEIRRKAVAIGIGWVSAATIDARGLAWALRHASSLALQAITVTYSEIVIDGTIRLVEDARVTTMKKADLLVPSVSAASIIAKVARDTYMQQVAKAFPLYGFASHVGYGTKKHRDALQAHGATPLHRMTFSPLLEHTELFKVSGVVEETIGRQAERFAAQFLVERGYVLVATNWRNKWCEIDIIVRRGGTLHFVEVKYRSNQDTGDGLAAITRQKTEQMRFAAKMWLQEHDVPAENYTLSALAVTGEPLTIAHWLPQL